MSLNQEERSAVVTYRLEKSARTMEEARFNMSGDYNDHYDLEESDVLPYVEPTARLISDVAKLATEGLSR